MIKKYDITGMTCAACSLGIEKNVSKLKGVKKAEVSLMGECMQVEYDEACLDERQIFSAVLSLGYGIYKEGMRPNIKNNDEAKILKKRFIFSVICLLPLMYFSMGGMFGWPQPSIYIGFSVQFILTLVIIVINFKFFTSGIKALIKRVPNMDTLVTLGATASFGYSLYMTVITFISGNSSGTHIYYESAAMLLTLVTLGKWLEAGSKKKTGKEIEKLIKMMPETVTVMDNGKIRVISAAELSEGDVLIIRSGDYIPVDGTVIEGMGFVDASAITGESVPVELVKYSSVRSGSILKSGSLQIKAEFVGRDTTISKIVKMVKDAAASKAPIQKLADTVAGIFVPAVVLIALLTFGIWFFISESVSVSLNYAIDVLVISCPCALGLATPVAIMAATGKGASLGVFYKNAEALQKTKDVNCVLFDKTGTITKGNLVVTDFWCDDDEEKIKGIAGGIEALSNHPMAECIRSFCNVSYPVEKFEYVVGRGAVAEYMGYTYKLGSRSFCIGAKNIEKCDAYSKEGKTTICLECLGEVIAIFAVADTVKEESVEAIKALKDLKIKTAMITGDSNTVAAGIATKVGIDDFYAEVVPQDKLEYVKKAQAFGGVVAMVGDGINDSPALMQSDIGIAMDNGTDVAIDSADIVLVGGNISKVATAINLSKQTMKIIKQNLFWAFFYNCIAIPVAAGAFSYFGVTLNPMLAAACMCLSSLFVVTNALRLTRYKENSDLKSINKENDIMEKKIFVEGMMCMHCVEHVTKALTSIPGVSEVSVNLKKKTADVKVSSEVSDEILIKSIVDAGYSVKKIK